MTAAAIWDLIQWLLLPCVAGLLGLVWHTIGKAEDARSEAQKVREEGIRAVAEAKADSAKALAEARAEAAKELGQFKLDVARIYASIDYLKDVEKRITDHLIRIEHKLDTSRGTGGTAD